MRLVISSFGEGLALPLVSSSSESILIAHVVGGRVTVFVLELLHERESRSLKAREVLLRGVLGELASLEVTCMVFVTTGGRRALSALLLLFGVPYVDLILPGVDKALEHSL